MPAGPRVPPRGASLGGWLRTFLLHRWAGRLLLVALPLLVLEFFGFTPFGGVHRLLLLTYAVGFGCWFVLHLFSGRLFYKIRTKLIVSYLFIALVPMFLLTIFFLLQAVIVLYAVGTHVVSAEIETMGAKLQSVADTTLVLERTRGLPRSDLEAALGQAKAVHPAPSFAVVDGTKVIASAGTSPTRLPGWWKDARWVGLVSDDVEGNSTLLLRAVARGGAAFVVVDAPLDKQLFAQLPPRGLTFLQYFGPVTNEDGDPDVGVDRDGARRTNVESPQVAGIPLAAIPDGLDWKTGELKTQGLLFWMDPRGLMGYLSTKGFRTPDIVRYVLIAVGVFFLAMYGVALLLGWLLARSITKNVYSLWQGTERLRGGDFTTPIRVTSRDQLGDLAESFNLMSAGIQDLLREQGEKERLEEELRIARRIQMSLLPAQGSFSVPGVRVAALCLPAAEVGGDYYDLLPLSEDRMGVLVADVSGKGTSAALYMAELKGLVLSLSRIYDSPARLLSEANRILSTTLDSRSFVTMTYAVVDARVRRMSYARAGHNPILRYAKATGETHVLLSNGLGLGLDSGDRFDLIIEEQTIALEPGDVFLFFTDGLSEAMNERSELYGEQRLRDVLESVRAQGMDEDALKERILEDIRGFVGEAAQHDDMTMVVLKVA